MSASTNLEVAVINKANRTIRQNWNRYRIVVTVSVYKFSIPFLITMLPQSCSISLHSLHWRKLSDVLQLCYPPQLSLRSNWALIAMGHHHQVTYQQCVARGRVHIMTPHCDVIFHANITQMLLWKHSKNQTLWWKLYEEAVTLPKPLVRAVQGNLMFFSYTIWQNWSLNIIGFHCKMVAKVCQKPSNHIKMCHHCTKKSNVWSVWIGSLENGISLATML